MPGVMEIILPTGLLITGVGLMVFIHVCVVRRAFRDDPWAMENTVPSETGQMPSMRAEDIEELPSYKYKMEEKEGRDCAVCLENFKAGEKCRLLPRCNHSFHAECIDSWLKKTGACPICRSGAKAHSFAGSSGFSGEGAELL